MIEFESLSERVLTIGRGFENEREAAKAKTLIPKLKKETSKEAKREK